MTLASAGQRGCESSKPRNRIINREAIFQLIPSLMTRATEQRVRVLMKACVGMHAAESWLLCGHWFLVQDCICWVRLFLLSMYQDHFCMLKVLFSTICCNDTLMAASSASSVPVIARLKKQAMRFIHVTPLQSIKSRPFPVDSGKILHAHVGS